VGLEGLGLVVLVAVFLLFLILNATRSGGGG